jgi:transposase
MSTDNPHYNKEWLLEKYRDEDLTYAEMGDLAGVTASTIGTHMKKHGIKSRDSDRRMHRDESWLKQKYVEEGMTLAEIGDLVNQSETTILKWIRRHNIETRSRGNRRAELDEELTNEQLSVIEGELLGDGNLKRVARETARFRLKVADEAHRDFVGEALEEMGFETRYDHRFEESNFTEEKAEKFIVCTLGYEVLAELHDTWYEPTDKGKNTYFKDPPDGLSLSPRGMLHWHLGDGSYVRQSNGNTHYALLSANGFSDSGHRRLVAALDQIDVASSVTRKGQLYIGSPCIDTYFGFMADPPAGVKEARFP